MVPTIRLFSGNLLSGAKPTPVASTEKGDVTESEEEKAQRLTAEENADLKRELALQNQSFTAQEIEEAAGAEGSAPTQRQPTQVVGVKFTTITAVCAGIKTRICCGLAACARSVRSRSSSSIGKGDRAFSTDNASSKHERPSTASATCKSRRNCSGGKLWPAAQSRSPCASF